MKKLAAIFIVWVVVANLFALLSLNRLNLAPDTAYPWIDPAKSFQKQTWSPINSHAKWDSFWYLGIAADGYEFRGYDKLSNIVFFPVYPLLIRLLTPALASDSVLITAGWLMSLVFLFLALWYLVKLVREFHKNLDPYLPIILLLIFPTAFFLNTVYTESIFLFFSIATFYYALKKDFTHAAVFGLLASLTRITGVLLLIPVLYEYYKLYGFKLNRKFLPLLLIPAGLLSFFAFHFFKFGDALLFFKIQSRWGRSFAINWDHLNLTGHPGTVNLVLDGLFTIFAVLATFLVFKKLRASYGLYMLATIGVALSTGTMMSIGRYVLVLFPIYILGAAIKNEYVRYAWILISALLFALYTILFVNYYWAG